MVVQRTKEAILEIPFMYNLVQTLVSCDEGRQKVKGFIAANPNDTVLDIGSGTSNVLDYLPPVTYYGFDCNPDYIDTARQKHADKPNATFKCETINEATLPPELTGTCDVVLAFGVIHHISDAEVAKLFSMAQAALKPGGRLVTIDPAFTDKQHPIAKLLVGSDRGEYVRHADEYKRLYDTYFAGSFVQTIDNLSRYPYTHSIVVATK